MTEIERVYLRGVDSCFAGHLEEGDHLRGRAWLDAHRPDRDLAADLGDGNAEHGAHLGRAQAVAFAAAAAADVDADLRGGQSSQVSAQGGLVELASSVESRDRDSEGLGPGRVARREALSHGTLLRSSRAVPAPRGRGAGARRA